MSFFTWTRLVSPSPASFFGPSTAPPRLTSTASRCLVLGFLAWGMLLNVSTAKALPSISALDAFDGWCTCPDGSIYACSPGMTYYMDPCYSSSGLGANPFEYLGEAHNIGLQWVAANLEGFLAVDAGFRLTAIASALGEQACSAIDTGTAQGAAEASACAASTSAGVLDGYALGQMSDADFVAKVAVSAQQAHYLAAVLSTIRQGEQVGFEGFLSQMATLENEIMASSMSDGEQAAPLMVAAVGRHSAFFWLSVGQNPAHPWQAYLVSQGRNSDDYDLFAADAKGALAGGITGALIGGVPTGGIGAVPGAFLGTLGGMWGGTLGEALF